jgi:putative hydrolase of HD superfamily
MTGALNMDLVYCLFDAVNMHRWNDHLRPLDLTEIDKQSHKAAIAWMLGMYEEESSNSPLEWQHIIEYGLFSFMQRAAVTDLKPQLFHQIEHEKFDELNDYVLSFYDRTVPDMESRLRKRFESYLRSPPKNRESRIVEAAHYMASYWEFNIIYDMNRFSFGIEQTKAQLYLEMNEFMDLPGVRRTVDSQSMTFTDLMSQLRFQKRWTRVPRIPETTVLGHSLMVADMAYLHDLDAGVKGRQNYNDFYTGLFHDLPEVLTKDVISPVKVSVQGLTELLDEYEHQLVNTKIMPLLPESWHDGFAFLVFDPFAEKNDPKFGRTDGKVIKLCDVMGAYLEANVSRRYGVSSAVLRSGEMALRERLEKEGGPIGAADLIKRFDQMEI